jgi:peptidoglycan/xylan/chitin deacetylase (PgdA/CDA1 family)
VVGSTEQVPADQAGIPVLTWHGFAESLPTTDNLTETYDRFEHTLEWLLRHGFRSVFPDEIGPVADRTRTVVLTFDDGTAGQARAAEIMQRYGFRGVFFVIPDRTTRGNPRYLDAAAVAALAGAGHRVAPHGYAHRSMAFVADEVDATLTHSAALIADQTTQPRTGADFAFPFGHYTVDVTRRVSRAYRYLHTVDPGYWDGRSPLVPRMVVMSDVDPAVYREYLLGGARYRPVLHPLGSSGTVTGNVPFRALDGRCPRDVHVLAVTADADDRSYVPHPADAFLRQDGDTVWFDSANYMHQTYPLWRAVLSYALVVPDGRGVRHLTPGLLNWRRDPGAGWPQRASPG